MALTIISIFTINAAQPINHYVRGSNGNHIQWTENLAEALEFADGPTADAFMSGKWNTTYQKTSVTGYKNYGSKSHS